MGLEHVEEFARELFSLLALGFRYPEKDIIENLKKASNLLAEGCPDGTLKDILSKLGSLDVDIRALQYEYTALYLLRYPESPCHPYESVYLEPDGRTMGRSTLEVLETYLKNGFVVEGKELPDHISLELEFIARGPYNAVKKFVEEHLSKWFKEFCHCVREKDRSGFYSLLAEALERAMELYF